MAGLARFNSLQLHRHQETLRTILYNRGQDVSHQLEETHRVFDWETEHQSEEWTIWWNRKLFVLLLLFLWHFFCIFTTLAAVIIYWESVQIAFNMFIASIMLFGKVIICFVGRKIHTGKILTRILILIDGFLSAYIHSSYAVNITKLKYNLLVYLSAAVALSLILAYILILWIVGIKLTTIRFHGPKILPIELCAASILLIQLPYLYIIDKKYEIAYHEYMAHIVIAELIGFTVCSGMACYLLTKLKIAVDKKMVQNGVSEYALRSPSESLPMELV